jgi:hypothetical protein
MRLELLKGLTDAQINKLARCKSAEEILELAKAEGVELNEEQLAAVSGGCGEKADPVRCNKCGSLNCEMYQTVLNVITKGYDYKWRCNDCGNEWLWD